MQILYKMGFLVPIPKHIPNNTQTFWTCFQRALSNNKKTSDGKRRILSIIANDFTYSELESNLNVRKFNFKFIITSNKY